MASATEELLAFPDTRARKLARVSMRRLRYWEETGLVVPSVRRRLSPKNTVRLYSFQDLLALLVVAELRTERDMSLQHIRRVVEHLRSRGYQAPLRELTFATLGQEIYFQTLTGPGRVICGPIRSSWRRSFAWIRCGRGSPGPRSARQAMRAGW
jgi:DNA-binding transcriptional MerR regulator